MSGVPQSSVLVPIMFLVYINGMPEGIRNCLSLIANDAKLLKKANKKEACDILEKDMDKEYRWNQT